MSASSLRLQVVGARAGTAVEIVPGKTYVSLKPEAMESLALAELVPAGDGTFRPVARICPRKFTISRANLRRLGIAISESGLRRLVTAGFVAGERITPGVHQFDYFDYLRHEAAVAADPEFWTRTEPEPGQRFTNLQRYQHAL
jgi:hypothetical protein